MPLAKTAEVVQEKDIKDHPQAKGAVLVDSVPLDMYSYFSTSAHLNTPVQADKIRDVYEQIREDGDGIGDVFKKLSDLESKLGMGGGDTRLDRVWNWLRIRRKANQLKKQLKALEKR